MLICLGENVEHWLDHLQTGKREQTLFGVLFGHLYEGEKDICLVIDGALEVDDFTELSWSDILYRQQELYPEKKILGWFCCSQEEELFFGKAEQEIHETYFPHPWQIAYLLNERNAEQIFFSQQGQEMQISPFYRLTIGNSMKKKVKVDLVKKQKKRKKNNSRRRFLKKVMKACFFVLFIAGLTFTALFLYNSYQDLLTLENFQLLKTHLTSMGHTIWQEIMKGGRQ